MSVCIPHESEETKRCQRTIQVNGRVLVVYWVSFHYLYDRLCSWSSGFIWMKLQHYWLQLQKHCLTSYITCSAEELWTAHSHLHNWYQGTNEDRLSGCESRLLFTNRRGTWDLEFWTWRTKEKQRRPKDDLIGRVPRNLVQEGHDTPVVTKKVTCFDNIEMQFITVLMSFM